MAPTNPTDQCNSLANIVRSMDGSDRNNVEVSTISTDYSLFGVGPDSEVDLPTRAAREAARGVARAEFDNQTEVQTSNSKQKIKKCFHAYKTLPPRTRQTLKIVAVAIVSVILLLSIFFLSKLAEQPDNAGLKELKNSLVENEVTISESVLKAEEKDPLEEKFLQPEQDTPRQPKVFKDPNGKAKLYGKKPEKKGLVFPHMDVDRLKARRNFWHRANETEIAQTLQRVKFNVDRDRKSISNKELRLWESGTEPLRILLVSTWRSGSTFLGQLLQSHPGVFQHYEPLKYIEMHQVRSGKIAFQAQQTLHRLLDCEYDNVEEYMNFTIANPEDMVGHNKLVWKSCKEGPNKMACIDAGFLSEACKMFPIQLVKTVRLRLNLTQLLLNDEKLRVKVVFLVRDPRGIMNSRYSSVDWCAESPDCISPSVLCQDMQGDLKVSKAFETLYPNRFIKVKYEDLAGDTEEEVRRLLSFLGLEYTDSVREFIEINTKTDKDAPWTIQRKSSDRIALWKSKLPLEEIHAVQNECEGVLSALKYEKVGV